MNKLTKHILILAMLPFIFGGCDTLFDQGDVEKSYDGPDTIGFRSLQAEVDEGSSQTMEVQLISANGVAEGDYTISFAVDEESTADESHYNIDSNSVTIAQGEVSASFEIEFPEDSGLDEGDEVTLILTLESGEGFEAGENIRTSTIFIQGVNE